MPKKSKVGQVWPGFLLAGLGIVLIFSTAVQQVSGEERRMAGRLLSPQEFKERLVGPVVVLPTPFTADLDVDYQGIRNIIRRALQYEARVFALTTGDSKYKVLSHEEIKEVTRVMVETVGDQGLTIAATGWGEERRNTVEEVIEYARYVESLGASALQVLLPKGLETESVMSYYRDIAYKTRLPLVLHGNFSEEQLQELMMIDSIVAMKEDVGLKYFVDRQIVFGDRLAIFPGGTEARYLIGYPYGSPAYYSVFYQFAPELGLKFWKAIEAGDIKKAGEFVKKYDHPYMKGWSHGRWHASMEYFGVAPRYLRAPYESFTNPQMEELKRLFDRLGVRPRKLPE